MQVIHWGRARAFIQTNSRAEKALKDWRTAVQEAAWRNFPEIKQTFNSADWVDGKVIFDIRNNDYRLIAIVGFTEQRVYIKQIMTHSEYDEGNWRR